MDDYELSAEEFSALDAETASAIADWCTGD